MDNFQLNFNFADAAQKRKKHAAMVKKTPQELAGTWQMTKDTNGKEKKGLWMKVWPAPAGGLVRDRALLCCRVIL